MLRKARNPYIAGKPVIGKEMFYGRDDVFDFLRQHLIGRYQDNVIMLHGQRRTGKTSILYQILNAARLGDDYAPVFIKLEGLQDTKTNEQMFLEIAVNIAVELDLVEPDFDKFDVTNHYFRHHFLPKAKKKLGERKLLLMIDEYEILERCADNPDTGVSITLFHQLRHLMQHFDWLSFILAGSHKLDELNPEYWKEFTGTIYHTISFLEPDSARQLIIEPAESITYSPQAVERILALSGGHPYFLQSLCHTVFNIGADKGEITVQDVDQAIHPCIITIKNGYESIWKEFDDGEKVILSAISSLDTPEVNRSEIAGQLDYFKVDWPLERITQMVDRLVHADILQQTEEPYRYCCRVPFLKTCVQTYHPLDKLLDDMGLRQKSEVQLINDPRVLKAKNYLRDAQEYIQSNNFEMARRMLESATTVCPDYEDSWLKWGRFYEIQQQTDLAISLYRDKLQKHTEWVRTSNALGLLLKKSACYQEALEQFQHSLKIQKNNNIALANIDEIQQWFAHQQDHLRNLPNPYIIGPPVRNLSMFFGRNDLLESILRKVTKSVSINLTGPRRIGKTSFLLHLEQSLPAEHISVFIDMQGAGYQTVGDLFCYIAKKISEKVKLDKHVDYESFLQHPYHEFDELLESLFEQKAKGIALIFDEYEHLVKRYKTEEVFFNYLRYIGNMGKVSFVMAGVEPIHKLFDWNLRGSPFYNIFMIIQMDLLDSESCRALITQPVSFYLSYTNDAIERIINLSGGHPFLVQAICSELAEIARTQLKSTITVPDAEVASLETIDRYGPFFDYLWDHLNNEAKEFLAAMVTSEKHFFNKQLPRNLTDHFIITTDNGETAFQMSLFELWLKKYRPWEKAILKENGSQQTETMFSLRSLIKNLKKHVFRFQFKREER